MGYSFYGFDHVQLAGPAGCEEEARRFFGDILGMEEMEKPEALKERLVSHGIPVQDDELLPGADRFYVDDPFGNRIECLEWKE
ncbi:hypothetical protein [Alicyclobacillus acidiphilus]|uniref:hypothetical protein n=1 Tax=Alicyclobacillus acidiphilus TaxID=182455 RepID=UPI000829FC4F|nr:hypothetical protein [Alicyclobacillus acidiphilus]